jgi:hypothetical protein
MRSITLTFGLETYTELAFVSDVWVFVCLAVTVILAYY